MTTLAEFSERIQNQFGQKFGADSLRIIKDSNPVSYLDSFMSRLSVSFPFIGTNPVFENFDPLKVNEEELESRYAYIQITSVLPYFDASEDRITEFERNHNVRRSVAVP